MNTISAMFLGAVAHFALMKIMAIIERNRFAKYVDIQLKVVLSNRYMNKEKRKEYAKQIALAGAVVFYSVTQQPINIGFPYYFPCVITGIVKRDKVYLKLKPLDHNNQCLFKEGIELPADVVFRDNKRA